MELTLIYAPWFVFVMPLVTTLALPFFHRIIPLYSSVPSTFIYGLFFSYSFFLLVTLTERALVYQTNLYFFRFGLYADKLTAATLLIVSAVCWQTILTSPLLKDGQDGFLAYLSFPLLTLFLSAFLLSDSLIIALVLWLLLDFGVLYGQTWKNSKTDEHDWKVFLLLQASSFFMLGSGFALWSSQQMSNFSQLAQLASTLSPTMTTAALTIIFIGAGIKLGSFPYSFWTPISVSTQSSVQALPLMHGVSAVIPGIYLLTRLSPLYEITTIPIPFLLLGATFLGFLVFIELEKRKYHG